MTGIAPTQTPEKLDAADGKLLSKRTIIDAYTYLFSGDQWPRVLFVGGLTTVPIGISGLVDPTAPSEFVLFSLLTLLSAPAWGYFAQVASSVATGDGTPPTLSIRELIPLARTGISVALLYVCLWTLGQAILSIVLGGVLGGFAIRVVDSTLGEMGREYLAIAMVIFVYPVVLALYVRHSRLRDAVDPGLVLKALRNRDYLIGAATATITYFVGVVALLPVILLGGAAVGLGAYSLGLPLSPMLVGAAAGGFASFILWVAMHVVIGRTWRRVQSNVIDLLPEGQLERAQQLYAEGVLSEEEYRSMSARIRTSPQQSLNDLEELHNAGVLTDAEYRSKVESVKESRTAAIDHINRLHAAGLLSKRESNRMKRRL